MKHTPEIDPLSEAPLLRSIPKVDPFVVPEGFFDRFPHQVQRTIVEQNAEAWWKRLLPTSLIPRAAWALGATLVAAVVWFTPPHAQEQAVDQDLARVEWDPESALDDRYLLAELSIDAAHAPGVQHDLSADELAAYLYAQDALDYLTELQ